VTSKLGNDFQKRKISGRVILIKFQKRKFPSREGLTKFGNNFQKRKFLGRVILVKFPKKEILMDYVSRACDPPNRREF